MLIPTVCAENLFRCDPGGSYAPHMQVQGIDERRLMMERHGADFLVFIYMGGRGHEGSIVDSYLLTDSDVPSALAWLRDNLPKDACWALGVVTDPVPATPETDVDVAWIIGADVLNYDLGEIPEWQPIAEEMLARRDSVSLL